MTDPGYLGLFQKGNPTPGSGTQPKVRGKGVTYVRSRNGGRLLLKKTYDIQ